MAPDGGRVYVLFGRNEFPAEIAVYSLFDQNGGDGTEGVVISGGAAADRVGTGVSLDGDFNNDGIDDLVIGSQYTSGYPDPETYAGEVSIIFGRDIGFPAQLQAAYLRPENGGDGRVSLMPAPSAATSTTARSLWCW